MVSLAAPFKDRVEEEQEARRRKEAGAVSQASQVFGLSQRGASAFKTAPAKEAGAAVEGVGVEAESWAPPLQGASIVSAAAATAEADVGWRRGRRDRQGRRDNRGW